MIDYGQMILSTNKRTTEVLFIFHNLFTIHACIFMFSLYVNTSFIFKMICLTHGVVRHTHTHTHTEPCRYDFAPRASIRFLLLPYFKGVYKYFTRTFGQPRNICALFTYPCLPPFMARIWAYDRKSSEWEQI